MNFVQLMIRRNEELQASVWQSLGFGGDHCENDQVFPIDRVSTKQARHRLVRSTLRRFSRVILEHRPEGSLLFAETIRGTIPRYD